MQSDLDFILQTLFSEDSPDSLFDPNTQFDTTGQPNPAKTLNAAFALVLSGRPRGMQKLQEYTEQSGENEQWAKVARFYLTAIQRIYCEIKDQRGALPELDLKIKQLADNLKRGPRTTTEEQRWENVWQVFFPEAVGVLSNPSAAVELLRNKRRITINQINHNPITDPATEILFTSNVLLTIPDKATDIDSLDLKPKIKQQLKSVSTESQQYWYDHPIPIGVKPEQNEILYGLVMLDRALDYERQRGNLSSNKIRCVLSVSVTHSGLHAIAKEYIEDLFLKNGKLNNIELYVFTDDDTQHLINQVFAPAAKHYLHHKQAKQLLQVLGVDGCYGRHYSFLKAIAALWQLTIDPGIKATFKIDLDQVFPQHKLVTSTGKSALEHFKTNLWGATGTDSEGKPVELGMLAGALVNQTDIDQSLFTADVKPPSSAPVFDERIFYSRLPQAVSTEAEMMYRRRSIQKEPKHCLQRVHVTGGTNGILLDHLKRYRCFTPSFIARAEDQAYILSTFNQSSTQLAYLHCEGLIMRHDKESFAQQSIKSNHIGKLLGDYLRILYFSSYAQCVSEKLQDVKDKLSPFSGCFISYLPLTVVYLRFCLKAAYFFSEGRNESGEQFILEGVARLEEAIRHTTDRPNRIQHQYLLERQGWELYYDTLKQWQKALPQNEAFEKVLKDKTEYLVEQCRIGE
ncbi:MAG: hypothetical protein JXA04_10715 [Gammaproteobacteria bacterium]|nr:hypothetical protein [Gammaproteobacteria bacterium]